MTQAENIHAKDLDPHNFASKSENIEHQLLCSFIALTEEIGE